MENEPAKQEQPSGDSWKRFGQVVQAALSVSKEEVKEAIDKAKGKRKKVTVSKKRKRS